MPLIKLSYRQVVQLESTLRYALKAYTRNKKSFKEDTEIVISELIDTIREQTRTKQ